MSRLPETPAGGGAPCMQGSPDPHQLLEHGLGVALRCQDLRTRPPTQAQHQRSGQGLRKSAGMWLAQSSRGQPHTTWRLLQSTSAGQAHSRRHLAGYVARVQALCKGCGMLAGGCRQALRVHFRPAARRLIPKLGNRKVCQHLPTTNILDHSAVCGCCLPTQKVGTKLGHDRPLAHSGSTSQQASNDSRLVFGGPLPHLCIFRKPMPAEPGLDHAILDEDKICRRTGQTFFRAVPERVDQAAAHKFPDCWQAGSRHYGTASAEMSNGLPGSKLWRTLAPLLWGCINHLLE